MRTFYHDCALRPLLYNSIRNRNPCVRRVLELILPFDHCLGLRLFKFLVVSFELLGSRTICIFFWNLEVETGKTKSWRNTYCGADLDTTRCVPAWFSCTNSLPFCTWRKVMDEYNRKKLSLPNYYIRIYCASLTLVWLIVWNTGCDPLFFATLVGATRCFLQHFAFYKTPTG